MSDAIHVGLYGDGSRKYRRRAEYIYCDHADECSAFKDGCCFNVTTPFGKYCKIGKIATVDGGTKQSKMFIKVDTEAKNHRNYGALKYPSYSYIVTVGEKVLLYVPHVNFSGTNDYEIIIDHPTFVNTIGETSRTAMTPENIKRICDFCPRTMFEYATIKDYPAKVVPMFLFQLAQVLPEEYAAFISEYPDYKDLKPDWIGRYAKLVTCNREKTYVNCHGDVFRFDGDWLVCDDYRRGFNQFGEAKTELRIKTTDDMRVKITNNDQVLPETVFV